MHRLKARLQRICRATLHREAGAGSWCGVRAEKGWPKDTHHGNSLSPLLMGQKSLRAVRTRNLPAPTSFSELQSLEPGVSTQCPQYPEEGR